MDEMCFRSCVHGFHVYSTIWNLTIGEVLPCRRELTNDSSYSSSDSDSEWFSISLVKSTAMPSASVIPAALKQSALLEYSH